jgi:N-methylhydantoinase A/oxoprolinase/acetone carboxylase beta subunit
VRIVVIAGVFSPLDADYRQEEQVASIISAHFPSIQTVLSKHVSNIGLLERENAAILNACLLKYAHTVVQEFQEAAASLHLTCPVMVTSNDGTLLSCQQASVLPIKTFSSGPTNSMRGAAFCCIAHGRTAEQRDSFGR